MNPLVMPFSLFLETMRAMKIIERKQIIKEEEEKLFAEVNILKTLDHPNILKIFELY
jgi:calcium-dependent protein kinase